MAKNRISLCTCGARAVCSIGFGRFCRECASEAVQTAPSGIASMQDPTLPTLYDVATQIAQAKAEANGHADTLRWLQGAS